MRARESFEASINKILDNKYKGYDPYDGANASYSFIRNWYYPRLFSTYLNKFSPVNMRYLLGIKPSRQNQVLGFIGRALLLTPKRYSSEIQKISKILINDSLIDRYGYHCWDSHGFPIQMLGNYRKPGMTDVIGNEAIGRFFLELYTINPDIHFKEICLSVKDFFQDKYFLKYELEHYFKYKPNTPEHQWCYNASSIAATYIATVSNYFNADYDQSKVESALKSVVGRQKPDGEWWYSLNLDAGYEKPQIDFHQGFILDALLEYMELTGFEEPFLSAYKKGLNFYYHKQFLPNGQSIYRYPKKWPVDIHNQAQGIITFTRAAKAGFGDHYFNFASTIAEWTIKNMQDKDGHFYFLKYPLFTNKIPYLRWSDANMAYALSVFLSR